MVDPRVQKAVEATLNGCSYIMTPRRWPTKVRRAHVLAFPLSFPIHGAICVLIMMTVLLAAAICFVFSGFLNLFDYLKQLWGTTDGH